MPARRIPGIDEEPQLTRVLRMTLTAHAHEIHHHRHFHAQHERDRIGLLRSIWVRECSSNEYLRVFIGQLQKKIGGGYR